MTHTDVLSIDLSAAAVLAYALADAGEGLRRDTPVVDTLLTRATSITGVWRPGPIAQLLLAQNRLDELTRDLWVRMFALFAIRDGIAEVDALSVRIDEYPWWNQQPMRLRLVAEREARLLELLDGDRALATRVLEEMRNGADAAAAIDAVHRELLDAEHLQRRVEAIRVELGLSEADARALVARVDGRLHELAERGFAEDDALVVVGLVEAFDLDFDSVVDRAVRLDISLPKAAGEFLTARGIGLELPEYDALLAADQFHDVFDTAGGSRVDDRFSREELSYVIEHPWKFTVGQVEGAEALISQPQLFNRIDTANENNEIFASSSFGHREPGDGVIADVDIKAFMAKTQVHAILGDYADQIDIANDPTGAVDGFHSQGDLRSFLADNPDLPEHVRQAASVALDAGWFDENWWQEHKNEIAAGLALLAAGSLAVFTSGTSLIVLGLVGAAVAGTSTTVINLANGDGWADDLVANTFSGFLIGVSAGSVVNGARALSRGAGVGNVGAIAGIVAGGSDIVTQGGADLLIPEELEDEIGSVAAVAGLAATPIDIATNARTVADGLLARQAGEVLDDAAELALRQAEETLAVYAARERLALDDHPAGGRSSG